MYCTSQGIFCSLFIYISVFNFFFTLFFILFLFILFLLIFFIYLCLIPSPQHGWNDCVLVNGRRSAKELIFRAATFYIRVFWGWTSHCWHYLKSFRARMHKCFRSHDRFVTPRWRRPAVVPKLTTGFSGQHCQCDSHAKLPDFYQLILM